MDKKNIECPRLEGTLKAHLGSIPAAMGRDVFQLLTIANSISCLLANSFLAHSFLPKC